MNTSADSPQSIQVSCVIPVFNEDATLEQLYEQLVSVLEAEKVEEFEILFIDDGSKDQSWSVIEQLCNKPNSKARALRFRRNFGKADALQSGFDAARGEIIFTLDADLQDDPKEIPAFLEKLSEGYDMVSGWKRVRNDPIDKTLPSKIFNALARAASGVELHDFNCGFKAYRREVTQSIQLFGEMHRFIPILAHAEGFRIGEIPVEHHPRRHGVSKYGSKRFLKGLLDLITVTVLTRYLKRPAHFFGGFGLVSGSAGTVILGYLTIQKMGLGIPIGNRPLFFLGILLVLLGVQLISIGLIGELINYHHQNRRRPTLDRKPTGTHE